MKRGVEGGQETAALFLGFMELAEHRRAGFKPVLPDGAAQHSGIRYAEQRDLDNDVRFFKRLCQVIFNQITLSAAPFACEQQRADRILFVAIVNEFTERAHMASSF